MPEPSHIERIRKTKGKDYIEGAQSVVKTAGVRKGHRVIVIGTRSHEHFLEALHHFAKEAGADSRIHITDHINDGSEEQKSAIAAAKEHKAEFAFFAFDPDVAKGRFPLYEALEGPKKEAAIVTMPGISEYGIKNYLNVDTAQIKRDAIKLARLFEENLGKLVVIETTGPNGEKLELKARLPRKNEKDGIFKVMADQQLARKGHISNYPGGETYIAPLEADGEVFLAPGTLTGDEGRVESGLRFVVRKSRIVDIVSHNGKDADLAKKLLDSIKGKNCNVWAELGIGVHRKIFRADNNLEEEKRANTFHMGIGDNHDYGDNVADNHFDVILANGKLSIGGKLFVDADAKRTPVLE